MSLKSSANISTSEALLQTSLLPCGCASFRCPPPQRRALRRQGAPFSPKCDRGIGKILATRRRCAFPLGACCARLVDFQLNLNPTVFPSPLLLARARSLSLSLPPYRDIHGSAAARSSFRAIAPAHDVRRGGGGGDLA